MTVQTAPLVQVIYVSSTAGELHADELQSLLLHSRRNNARDGITGMLLYAEGSILQVLEGPADAVDRTYEKIERDDRHRGLIRLVRREISEREFGDWSMALARPNRYDLGAEPDVQDLLDRTRGFATLKEGAAKRLLERFRSTVR